jgi:hypothetical protein
MLEGATHTLLAHGVFLDLKDLVYGSPLGKKVSHVAMRVGAMELNGVTYMYM